MIPCSRRSGSPSASSAPQPARSATPAAPAGTERMLVRPTVCGMVACKAGAVRSGQARSAVWDVSTHRSRAAVEMSDCMPCPNAVIAALEGHLCGIVHAIACTPQRKAIYLNALLQIKRDKLGRPSSWPGKRIPALACVVGSRVLAINSTGEAEVAISRLPGGVGRPGIAAAARHVRVRAGRGMVRVPGCGHTARRRSTFCGSVWWRTEHRGVRAGACERAATNQLRPFSAGSA